MMKTTRPVYGCSLARLASLSDTSLVQPHTRTHTLTHTYTQTHTQTHTSTHTNTHIHTHKHINFCPGGIDWVDLSIWGGVFFFFMGFPFRRVSPGHVLFF